MRLLQKLLSVLVICVYIETVLAASHSSQKAINAGSSGEKAARLAASGSGSRMHELYAWGLNSVGQLGLVDFQDRRKPTLVSVLQGKNVTQIAMGGSDQVDSHTLVIVAPGKLFTTGDNTYGQLGLGDTTDRESFIPVRTVFSEQFVQVAAGESHSVALTAKGEVYVWGNNMRTQVALEDSSAQTSLPKLLQLPLAKGDKAVGVAAGEWHTVVWTRDGAVYACGDNSFGQLGVGDKKAHQDTASLAGAARGLVKVAAPAAPIQKIVCGGHHCLLITKAGGLYGWGKGTVGQLGTAQADVVKDYPTPTPVPSFTDAKVVGASCGFTHSVVVTSEGSVFVFGDNSNGQLGLLTAGDSKTMDAKFTHTPLHLMPQVKFEVVAAGRYHTMLLTSTGKVYTTGTNMNGQLGTGDMASRSTPMLISKLNAHRFVQVIAGAVSSMAISDAGDLYGWGRNNVGQLGVRRSKNPKLLPEFILSARDSASMSQVVGGGYAYQYEGHSMVLLGTGEVFSWGWNAFGQLGLGESEEAQSIPQKNSWLLKQEVDVKQIAVGQFASAAVTADGEVFTWGQNEAGTLGRGDFNSGPIDVPQKIHLDISITQVSIGYSHMLGLSADGRVYSWGHNFYGQLGVGDHKDKNTPQLISYLQDERVSQVAAGQYHSLAISVHGEMYGWGYNRDYELGVGDNMDRVLPQAIPALSGRKMVQVAAGGYHVLALTDDGALFSWGMNNFGQLGHRERSTSKVPTAVTVTAGVQDSTQVGKRLKVIEVAAGTWHSVVLAENNGVYTFGRCQYGQLGTKCQTGDRSQDQFIPERVNDGLEAKKVVGIAAGAAHTFAIVSEQVH